MAGMIQAPKEYESQMRYGGGVWIHSVHKRSSYALISQLAEEIGSNPIQCGFESHLEHHYVTHSNL